MTKAIIRFLLNGRGASVSVPPAKTLLRVLREDFGLTAAKPGCEAGECGACTVLLDGRPVTSCLVLAAQVNGREVTTLEGLVERRELGPLLDAFVREGAVQCGYCTPGFVVASYHALKAGGRMEGRLSPTLEKSLEGNICRCGGYPKIFSAVRRAASEMKEGGARP